MLNFLYAILVYVVGGLAVKVIAKWLGMDKQQLSLVIKKARIT